MRGVQKTDGDRAREREREGETERNLIRIRMDYKRSRSVGEASTIFNFMKSALRARSLSSFGVLFLFLFAAAVHRDKK